MVNSGIPTFPGLPSQVLRFDIATGQKSVLLEQPTPSPDSLGFVSFLGLVLGPEGDLFVSDFANDIKGKAQSCQVINPATKNQMLSG